VTTWQCTEPDCGEPLVRGRCPECDREARTQPRQSTSDEQGQDEEA
jgi:hypothetical protein